MDTYRLRITKPDGKSQVREVLDTPDLDERDLADVLGLAGGEQVELLELQSDAPPSRRIAIDDLGG